LPFATGSVDVVHSRNALDHTRNAGEILSEIARVLRKNGAFLLACDVRDRGGGAAHPYKWSRDVLEERVFAQFQPVRPPVVMEVQEDVESTGRRDSTLRWVSHLRKR
jgi:SAM-dependent methyltransferase